MSVTETTAAGIESAIKPWHDRLLGLDTAMAHHKPAPDRWSFSEVIGHLVDSACNNHQRFVRARGVEDLVFPKYDQNEWVSAGNYIQSRWDALVRLWYCYNLQIAHTIRNIPADQLSTPCAIGPYEPCTLEFLVTDYLDHLNHHLDKLSERMSE